MFIMKNDKDCRQPEGDGPAVVRVGDVEFDKDRLAQISASIKSHRASVKAKQKKRQPKKRSLWNRPNSETNQHSQRKSVRKIFQNKLPLICASCFIVLWVVLIGIQKLYYRYHLPEIAEAEEKAFLSRKVSLAGYEVGSELDSVAGYQKLKPVDYYEKCEFFSGISNRSMSQCRCRYAKETAIEKDAEICGIFWFSKIKVTVGEYEAGGRILYKIIDICLISKDLPDDEREHTFYYNKRMLEKVFGRSGRHRSWAERLAEFCANMTFTELMFRKRFRIFRQHLREEEFVALFAIMDLENNKRVYIDATEPGLISIGLSLR